MPFIIIDPPSPFADAMAWARFVESARDHISKLPEGDKPAARAELEAILKRRPRRDLWDSLSS